MSTSARKPRGPTAMLVGIPNKRCFIGALGDFLDLLLNMVLIHVDVRERAARLPLHSLTRRDECSSHSLVLRWEFEQGWQFELRGRISHALATLVGIHKTPSEPLSTSVCILDREFGPFHVMIQLMHIPPVEKVHGVLRNDSIQQN